MQIYIKERNEAQKEQKCFRKCYLRLFMFIISRRMTKNEKQKKNMLTKLLEERFVQSYN